MKLKTLLTTLAAAVGLTTASFGEAVETVAYWNKDFGTATKGGYTLTLGDGTTLNSDGTVSLTSDRGSHAYQGVVINFYDENGATAFSGKNLTVLVKYSGLALHSERCPLLSTIWGASKDAGELVLSAKGKNKMYYAAGITSSNAPTDKEISSFSQTIPTEGLMLVTMAGGGTVNGTRIGFAAKNSDGSYGDFVDYGYNTTALYAGKSFYGIKVGGTIGAKNHFYRPAMKVEGVAIINGFTTTMKTFRYLFPDEAYRFDYANNNPTSETKYIDGLTVKVIKDAVFSAKVTSGSISWVGGMVSACLPAYTPSEESPTKVALQYQVRESDYDKSADIYFIDQTDGVYFKKTGGHYNAVSGDKLGTDDAKWSNSNSAYNFKDFSVYVPYSQTATAATGNWSELGWTADDVARLDVADAATLTVDAASEVALLKVAGSGKLTLKYTDAAKLVAAKIWDFTEATGKVALDCSEMTVTDTVTLLSGTIKGSANIDVEGSALPANTKLIVSDTAVTLVGVYTASVTESVNFSSITWTPSMPAGGIPKGSILTITATDNPTITFTASETLDNLTINGAVTFKADDTLYTDGCWEKAILTVTDFTAGDIAFADVKEGFVGAYTKTDTGFKLRAQNKEVISINICGGSGSGDSPSANVVSGSDFYGIAPTVGDSWNNINKQWQGGDQTITIKGPKANNGTETVTRPSMSLSATGKNTYQANISNPFLRGYLDDGSGVTVVVEGIPYTTYDVIVYATSDSSGTPLAPITINGTQYTYKNGAVTTGSDTWGQGMYATPEIGKNALMVTGCDSGTLTINATRTGGRATLCAVQVINMGGAPLEQIEYVADMTGDVTWTNGKDANLTSYGDDWANGQLSTITITNKAAGATLTFGALTEGQHIKIVSAEDCPINIVATSLALGKLDVYDFSEAAGGVTIKLPTDGSAFDTANLPVSITGNWKYSSTGLITFDGTFPGSTDQTFFKGDEWQGTVWLKNVTIGGHNFGNFCNTNSVLRFTGVTGWMSNGKQNVATLELVDDGETLAYEIWDSSQNYVYTIAKIIGSGSLKFATKAGSGCALIINDVSEFTGKLLSKAGYHRNQQVATTARPIFIGDEGTIGTTSLISVADGETVKAGCGWEAESAAFGATLTVKGAVGDTIVSGLTTAPTLATKVTLDPAADGMSCLTYADGAVKVAAAVGFTVSDCNNASVTVAGAFAEGGSYYAADGTAIKVTYTADEGYAFASTGSGLLVIDTTAAQGATISAGEEPTDDVEAKIGTVYYTTFAGAVAAANEMSSATVEPLVDATIEADMTVNDTVAFKIAEGLTLTVKKSGLKASKFSNSGTIAFVGGTAEAPIDITGDGNLGTVTLAENTYVKNDDKGTARTHVVTGSGATSFYTISRNGTGGPGMTATDRPNCFTNVIICSTASGNNDLWIEHGAFDADGTVGLNVTGRIKLSDLTTPIVVRSVSGDKTLSGQAFTIKCTEDADFAGTSSQAITIDAGTATQTFSGSMTSTLTVNEDATVRLTGSAKPSSITNNGTVIYDFGADTTNALKTASFTNNGTVEVKSGVVLVPSGFPGTITASGTGVVLTSYTVGINDLGKFAIPAGKTWDTIVIVDKAGNVLPITSHDDTYVYFDWEITGGACWWDYEFDGNVNNSGTEGTALTWDGDRPFKGAEFTEDGALHVPTRPWRNVSSWPTTATFVMFGKMVASNNTYQIVFGSTTYGSYNTIFLATGDTSKDEVVLCRGSKQSSCTKLCTMTVPNAASADHLYAFTLKTVDNKTSVDIYLDGELLQAYPFDEAITLGTGFQIASPHGGVVKGYARPSDSDPATLDWLRVYDTELSQAAIEKYAVEYPYVSPNGSYQRTVKDGDVWSATSAWTKEGTEPEEKADVPVANATVKLTVDGTTTLGVNLDESISYEAIKINGGDLTLALAEGETEGKVISVGRVTANANVTFKYDAFTMFNAPLTVKAGKTVTFDLSMVDMTKFFSTQHYDLTGYVTLEDGANVAFVAPTELHGREVSAAIDETTKHYILTVTVPVKDFTYENGTWKWGDSQTVDAETVSNNTTLAIVVKSGTLEWPMDRASFTVEAGTLKATKAGTATITVEEGATFDVNGLGSSLYTVTLNGGSLVNTGADIGDSKQVTAIALTKNSTVGGTGGFSVQGTAAGQYSRTSIDLDEYTLTKTGDNSFALVNTDIDGTGTLYVEQGILNSTEETVFTNGTLKIGANGTVKNRVGKTLTVATVVGEGGTLENNGTVSDFTLSGTLAIANAGGFGTITMADGAVVNAGEKRGLTFAGAGTVNVTLTDAEIAAGSDVTVFTSASEDVKIGTVVDKDGNAVKCGIAGGVITPPKAKIGDVYYITLAAANAAAQDGDTITLLADASGAGIFVEKDNLTFDFGGFTYTVTGPAVGSTGTATQGFHIEAANCTIQNGTLTSTDPAESNVKMLVQNYSNLTLADITLDGTNISESGKVRYVLSNNNGSTTLGEGVVINANAGDFAFDVCRYKKNPSVAVTVDGATINGNIEVSASEGDVKEGCTLTLTSGTVNGSLVMDSTAADAVVTKTGDVTLAAPAGYLWDDNGKLVKAGAKIGDVYYITLAAANAAAEAGQMITLLADASGAGIFVEKDNLTFDFGGFTYTVTGPAVGSTGTATQGFHIEAANCTIQNGTLTSTDPAESNVKMLVQNYSNLTLANITLDGTNISEEGKVRYVLSNNNGSTTLGTGVVINANAGDFAFDVCRYKSNPSVAVTVDGATINGNIEVSASEGDVKEGCTLTLTSGTVNGSLVMDSTAAGATVTKTDAVELDAPEGYEWKNGVLTKKAAGPEPAPGSDANVTPVPGLENTYEVTPTAESKAVVLQNVKSGDTLIVNGGKVDTLTVNDKTGVTVTVMNSNGNVDITDAVYGWPVLTMSANDGATFSTALDPVKVGFAFTGITVGANVEIGVTSFVGLTYTLVGMDEVGGEETVLTETAQVAGTTATTLTDTASTKKFYKVQVTK